MSFYIALHVQIKPKI